MEQQGMTTEEKAKAYDEALERAKKYNIDDAHAYQGTIVKLIFPELAKSEDERIRKELIEQVGYIIPDKDECDDEGRVLPTYHKRIEQYRAYLEKQKEQKPADEQFPPLEGLDAIKAKYYDDGFKNGFDEGVESVKPTEWSEEDKEMIERLIRHTQKEFNELCNDRYGHQEIISDLKESCRERMNWLENRLKSLRPQLKQERQIKEGDKVNIHCRKDRKEDIIAIYDGKVGEVIHVWDAKGNPWGYIVVRLDNGCNDGFYEDELEVLDEPSWKPSEEQIEALKECGECKRCIKKLYEDLQKKYGTC